MGFVLTLSVRGRAGLSCNGSQADTIRSANDQLQCYDTKAFLLEFLALRMHYQVRRHRNSNPSMLCNPLNPLISPFHCRHFAESLHESAFGTSFGYFRGGFAQVQKFVAYSGRHSCSHSDTLSATPRSLFLLYAFRSFVEDVSQFFPGNSVHCWSAL